MSIKRNDFSNTTLKVEDVGEITIDTDNDAHLYLSTEEGENTVFFSFQSKEHMGQVLTLLKKAMNVWKDEY